MKTTTNFDLKKPDSTDYYNIEDQNTNMDVIDEALNSKVQKVNGKKLSTEDYTTVEKSKLAGIYDWATGLFSLKGHNHDTNYLSKADKALDSEKLDGKDSTAFASNNHNHTGVYENVISKKSGFNLDKSDSITSDTSQLIATSKAVFLAYSKALEALSVASSKPNITISPNEPINPKEGDLWIESNV